MAGLTTPHSQPPQVASCAGGAQAAVGPIWVIEEVIDFELPHDEVAQIHARGPSDGSVKASKECRPYDHGTIFNSCLKPSCSGVLMDKEDRDGLC